MWAEMLVRNTLSSYHKNYGHKAQAQVSYRAYPEPTPKSADLEKQKKKNSDGEGLLSRKLLLLLQGPTVMWHSSNQKLKTVIIKIPTATKITTNSTPKSINDKPSSK